MLKGYTVRIIAEQLFPGWNAENVKEKLRLLRQDHVGKTDEEILKRSLQEHDDLTEGIEMAKPLGPASQVKKHWTALEKQILLRERLRGKSHEDIIKAHLPHRTLKSLKGHVEFMRKGYPGKQLSEILGLMIKENGDLASHISVPKPGESQVHRRRHRDNKRKAASDDDHDGAIIPRPRKRTRRVQYSENQDSQEDGEVYAKDKRKKKKDEDGSEDGGGFAEGGAAWSENFVRVTRRMTRKMEMEKKP